MPEALAQNQPEQDLPPRTVFVIKTVTRCNLACTYCYEYEMGDDSLLDQPPVIPGEVITQTAKRVAEHAEEYNLPGVLVVYHGGEPLMAEHKQPGFHGQATATFRRAMQEVRDTQTTMSFGMQSNGILLTRKILESLREHGINLGLSIDGNAESHDEFRRFRDGRPSFDLVLAGTRLLLREFSDIQATTLCYINPHIDLLRSYHNLAALGAKSIEFLWPLANVSNPPLRPKGESPETIYADLLIPVFEEWFYTPIDQRPSIPFFEEIIRMLAGLPTRFENIGRNPVLNNIFIGSDGRILDTDTLKSTKPGMTDLDFNVFDHSFSDVLRDPTFRRRQLARLALSDQCLSCPWVNQCGGGYYVHRFKDGPDESEVFRNPSIYCTDLFKLIDEIAFRAVGRAQFIRGAQKPFPGGRPA